MLRYIGDGSWIPGVPPRDLSESEVKDLASHFDRPDIALVLVSSGLYVEEKIDHRTRANKALLPDAEDK